MKFTVQVVKFETQTSQLYTETNYLGYKGKVVSNIFFTKEYYTVFILSARNILKKEMDFLKVINFASLMTITSKPFKTKTFSIHFQDGGNFSPT